MFGKVWLLKSLPDLKSLSLVIPSHRNPFEPYETSPNSLEVIYLKNIFFLGETALVLLNYSS